MIEYRKGFTTEEPEIPIPSHLNSKKGGDDYYTRTDPSVFEKLEPEAAKSTAEKLFRDNFEPTLGSRTLRNVKQARNLRERVLRQQRGSKHRSNIADQIKNVHDRLKTDRNVQG